LQVLNELERGGVIDRYAIGGAMGATFYVEPLLTFDLDVFVVPPQSAAGLLSLASLHGADDLIPNQSVLIHVTADI
jgi:hypothetical protein